MDPKVVSALVRARQWDALTRYVEAFGESADDRSSDDESADDRSRQVTLGIGDIVSGVPKEHLGQVVEVNLSSTRSRDEVYPISEDELASISKFFQENELPRLASLRVDGRPNAKDVLQRIFGSADTKKTLYSLSFISAIKPDLKDGEELSKDVVECIFQHFQDYPRLMRSEPMRGAYRTKTGIIEEFVAPLTIRMNTAGMGTYLPWFTGDYRDGKRVSKDRRFKCRYTTQRRHDSMDDVPLYITIEVVH